MCISFDNLVIKINDLPCEVRNERYTKIEEELDIIRNNELKHLNYKINALLFTVLGSVILMIIIFGIKTLLNIVVIG